MEWYNLSIKLYGGIDMECAWCDGTGKFLKPRNENKFDEAFDKYDSQGCFTHGQCRKMVLEEVGYDEIECPKCNGTGTI